MFLVKDIFELLQAPLTWIKWAKDQGLWDFVTAGSGLLISSVLVSRWKKKIPEFSVHLTYSLGTGHKNYPNVLNIELRNLMDSPLVIGRPNFKFAPGLKAGRFAHGNTATGDYEIKFRPIGADGQPIPGYSYTHVMLRHREQAYSYLPLPDEWDEAMLCAALEPKRLWGFPITEKGLGTLFLNVVLLKDEKPKVITMAVPIIRIQKGVQTPRLGREW
ncbi:MAG: hypothetical protein KJ614_16640 [Gammaproteobacteria bacterium]|uniref:hypothetical protein n=1 Tax=Rhodoferax sp. TaxID=50421 RepID=UPI0017F16E2A|nr:hypothetical protein [Rhodoferax sp.]MBU3900522.1 hypothetical protein [Gammaproteobacteria bacterium]MBA3057573.1 hypothetical protein [Rhodoferax sp.]MBU3996427.1 hypothetical protein [Gammaproteobacteria bacterium]MBU4079967.1 hypothetical protein [Gammaproteobacteria bacterium]MBU4113423.1 hypothetical protein [Gammaproteobacteria bacterium]